MAVNWPEIWLRKVHGWQNEGFEWLLGQVDASEPYSPIICTFSPPILSAGRSNLYWYLWNTHRYCAVEYCHWEPAVGGTIVFKHGDYVQLVDGILKFLETYKVMMVYSGMVPLGYDVIWG